MAAPGRNRAGNAMIEFVLVGIPMIFVLISVFEMARGMWLYHTMAYAMKEGTRFAIVRGNNCTLYPNACTVRVREIATRIKDAAVGFVPTDLQDVVFDIYDSSGNQVAGKQIACATLEDCLKTGDTGDTYWPANQPGLGEAPGAYQFFDRIEISCKFPFRSALAMFWPGTTKGINFGEFWFPASSREAIQF